MTEEKKNPTGMDAALQRPDYKKELIGIIRSNTSPKILQERLLDYHENDIADIFDQLTPPERQKLYRTLDNEVLSDIFEYLEHPEIYFNELNARRKVDLLSEMDADKAVYVLKHLGKEERATLVDLIDDESRRDIVLIASFDEEEIGSIMTTNFIEIHTGLTVRQARSELVAQAAEHDNISTIYVVDESHTFYGAIDLKDLIIARDTVPLEDLITTSYPYVYAQENISECIDRLRDYSEDSIPVLDNNNQLLGVITSQDLVQLIDDEMGDDYAKLAGLASEEELNEPLRQSVKKRLPWLIILLGLGMVVSSVVGMFEHVVAQLTIVMLFQSLILDMAGNVGTQSLAVTIRVLVDETLTTRQKLGLVWKETRVGFINGVLLGTLSFFAIGTYIYFFKQPSFSFAFAISGCIGIALLLSMVISGLCGTAIPMIFKKLGFDPAAASGPLITTLNDLTAVISYYGLAWIFLIQVLHLAD